MLYLNVGSVTCWNLVFELIIFLSAMIFIADWSLTYDMAVYDHMKIILAIINHMKTKDYQKDINFFNNLTLWFIKSLIVREIFVNE